MRIQGTSKFYKQNGWSCKNPPSCPMCTIENLCDLNKDTNINSHDLETLIEVFGSREGDQKWNPAYDIYKEGFSEGRIDIGDIVLLLREINKQDAIIQSSRR